MSFRDVEDLLAQRSITATYETIRQWCRRCGPSYARTLRRRRGRMGDTWHLDELFVSLTCRSYMPATAYFVNAEPASLSEAGPSAT